MEGDLDRNFMVRILGKNRINRGEIEEILTRLELARWVAPGLVITPEGRQAKLSAAPICYRILRAETPTRRRADACHLSMGLGI